MKGWKPIIVVAAAFSCPAIALAQQAGSPSHKTKSPGELAVTSQMLAEKNEDCRVKAKIRKLTFLKRRRFVRDCVNGK